MNFRMGLLLLIGLAVAGCEIEGYHVDKAVQICRRHKGIHIIGLSDSMVICRDGYKETYSLVEGK